jgi:acetyl esterase/lipase
MTAALLSLSLLAGFVSETARYGPADKQQVDVVRPDGARGLPVLVFLHGGVWQFGDRRDFANVGPAFAGRGFVVVNASYRLAPAARWPAQIEDAAAIVALVKQRATSWGGDPARIALVGHSAGAQLAMVLLYDHRWLAARKLAPTDIKAVVNVSGVFDLRAPLDEAQDDGGFARFVAPVFGNDVDVLRQASPIDIARKTGTPLLFITGPDDYAAMQEQTQAMARRIALLGEKAPIVVVKGRSHFELIAGIGAPGDRTTDAIAAFLKR